MSLMPSDVRGIDGDRSVAQPNGEAAHGAPVDVGFEYATSKRGITPPSARLHEVRFDAQLHEGSHAWRVTESARPSSERATCIASPGSL